MIAPEAPIGVCSEDIGGILEVWAPDFIKGVLCVRWDTRINGELRTIREQFFDSKERGSADAQRIDRRDMIRSFYANEEKKTLGKGDKK